MLAFGVPGGFVLAFLVIRKLRKASLESRFGSDWDIVMYLGVFAAFMILVPLAIVLLDRFLKPRFTRIDRNVGPHK